MSENIQRKSITSGLNLVIIKQLSQFFIEFHIENLTESLYLVQFTFKDLQNVLPKDNELQVRAQILPNSTIKLTELKIKGSFSYKYQYAFQKLNLEPNVKIIEILTGLNLMISQIDTEQKVHFEVISQRREQTHFELTFTDMNGIVTDNNSTTFRLDLAPKSTGRICSLQFTGEWSYKYGYKYWFSPVSVDLKPIQQQQHQEILESKARLFQFDCDLLPLEELEKLIVENRFTDPNFPPNDYSIYGPAKERSASVRWARPEEFMEGEIMLYKDDIGMSDIHQGELGDCWLMCALCALSGEENRIKNLILNEKTSQKSLYRIKLYKNGEPVLVTIDDYFPCKPNGEPLFSRNNGSELWVLILEKAYAKLHGSYFALKQGFASEAVIDLTGCPADTYNLKEIENLWDKLEAWIKGGYKLVAGSGKSSNRSDIVAQHYYSITRLEQIDNARIIQLRNPWGDYEWLGDWSDESKLWTPELLERFNVTLNLHDGSFWMGIEDFSGLFTQIMVASIKKDNEYRSKSLIHKTNEAAKAKNCWEIKIDAPSTISIGIHQEDERCEGVKEYRRYLDLGLCILKKTGSRHEFYAATKGNHTQRDVFWEGKMEVGDYIVIPLSTGTSLSRPYDAKPLDFPLLLNGTELHPVFQSTVKDIFRKLNPRIEPTMKPEDLCLQIDKEELEPLWKLLCDLDLISIKSLANAFLHLINELGERAVLSLISHLGYDFDLYSVEAKPIVLSIQSESRYEVLMQDLDPGLHEQAWQACMHYMGNIKTDEDNLQIRSLSHSSGCSLMAINLNSFPLKVSIDMSKAENIEYTSSLTSEFALEPYQCHVFQHLNCERNKERYKYPFTYTIVAAEL